MASSESTRPLTDAKIAEEIVKKMNDDSDDDYVEEAYDWENYCDEYEDNIVKTVQDNSDLDEDEPTDTLEYENTTVQLNQNFIWKICYELDCKTW